MGIRYLTLFAAAVLPAACTPATQATAASGADGKGGKKVTQQPTTLVTVPAGKEIATLAGGCFWCTEAVVKELRGVEKVLPGYAGGTVARPSYEQVCAGTTGHAEAIQVTFDPKVIPYKDLLRIFLTTHDPTTLNRQGADVGTQYRSAVFTHGEAQKKAAQEVIRELSADKIFDDPIVTEVTPFTNFYQAEDYHLDYYARNAGQPYCRAVIAPKIAKLRQKYAAKLKQ